MDYGEPIGSDEGAWFKVTIFEDYVVKKPKKDNISDERLAEIAEAQTYLSEQMEEVLPCWKVGNTLVMPRASGVRVKEMRDKNFKRMKKRFSRAVARMKELGYIYTDSMSSNAFYDAENDRLYIVDFHSIKSLPGKGGE